MADKKTLDKVLNDELSLERLAAKTEQLTENDLQRLKDLTEKQKEMADFLIMRFQDNIEAFKQYMPDIAKTFEHYRPKRSMEFFCMENGIPNLIFLDINDIVYKTMDPFALCKKQVEILLDNESLLQSTYGNEYDPYGQIHFKFLNAIVGVEKSFERKKGATLKSVGSIPNAIILGIGLGYQLAYLYERIEIANLLIIEPDLDLFFASLHAFDWKNLLTFLFENKYGIHIMLGQSQQTFFNDMAYYYTKHGRFLSGSWLCYVHYLNDNIRAMAEMLVKDYETVHACMGFFDDHLFGTSHGIQAVLGNNQFVLNQPKMPDSYIKTPVFVIGSGPSLDHDIPFIRKYQDKAIIVACGTAVDTLYHAGIKPDFYACTERTPEISTVLKYIPDKDFYNDIILLTCDVIHPYTTKLFKHSAIFGKIDEPFYKYMATMNSEMKKVAFVQLVNPLVGNMGFSGSVYLGFKNIYLFGIDNGKKTDGKYLHSKYTTLYRQHNDSKSDEKGSIPITMTVKGNFGGTVESGYFFKLCAHNIGFIARDLKLKDPDFKVYNCSDGAFIEATEPTHSEDLEELFSKFDDVDKIKFHDFMYNQKTAKLDVSRDEFKHYFTPKDFNDVVDRIIKVLKKGFNTRLECVLLMEETSEILAYLEANLSTYFIASCINGSLQAMFMVVSKTLYKNKNETDCVEKAHEIFEIIYEFLDESKTLYERLPDYIMGEHKKYYPDGKVGTDYPHCKATPLPEERAMSTQNYDDPIKKFVKKYE
ncbi:MAG: 6-hydroxymethylpterin diphosphokinase MptE-like protein [Succinivibrio sp.]